MQQLQNAYYRFVVVGRSQWLKMKS